MAISFVQNSGVTSNVGTTNTQNPSVTGGTDMIALVWVETSTIGVEPTSVTWGGVSMTKINTFSTGTSRQTQISLWGLLLGTTTTGSKTITATWASSYSTNLLWATYSGVSQSNSIASLQNSTNGTTGSTTTTNEITSSITPSFSNSWLVCFGIDLTSSIASINSGTTVRYWGNWSIFDSGGVVSGPSTLGITMSSAALFGNNAVVLIPTGATAPTTGSKLLLSYIVNQ